MGLTTTFGAFTTARLGIYASQKALDVVGNNIANINTTGYTRQSLNQRSLNLGGADKYSSKYDIRVGTGALVTSVNQLRDPYLDIRYRNENSNMNAAAAKLSGLNDISAYLDEVGKSNRADGDGDGVLEAMFNELISQVQHLSAPQGIGQDSSDTLVRSAADALVKQIRKYATDLDALAGQQEDGFKQDLENVNTLLESIRNLNSSIRKSQIYGSDALELKDERNMLIDELSGYMRINVQYQQEDLGNGKSVEKLVIKLAGADTVHPERNAATLVDGIYAAKLSVRKVPKTNEDGDYLKPNGDETTDEKEAARVQDPNYNIDVGPLQDKYYRTMKIIPDKTPVGTYTAAADAQTALTNLLNDPATPTEGYEDGMTIRYDYKVTEQDDGNGNQRWIVEKSASYAATQLTDNTLYGSLQSERELLTEAGEYATEEQREADPNAATKRGIPYYRKALDTLANTLANTLNNANRPLATIIDLDLPGSYDPAKIPSDAVFKKGGNTYQLATTYDGDGNKIFQKAAFCDLATTDLEVGPYLTEEQIRHFIDAGAPAHYVSADPETDANGNPLGAVRPLFSNNGNTNDTRGITASNISISKDWSNGLTRILQSTDPDAPSTDNTNTLHILNLLTGDHEFKPDAADLDTGAKFDDVFFKGSFQEFFTDNMGSTLADDIMTTEAMYQNYTTTTDELYTDRDSVSGVDLNDEAMNLMQFQKSYSAACRLMTTIDELLDKLINGTGRVGL